MCCSFLQDPILTHVLLSQEYALACLGSCAAHSQYALPFFKNLTYPDLKPQATKLLRNLQVDLSCRTNNPSNQLEKFLKKYACLKNPGIYQRSKILFQIEFLPIMNLLLLC